MISYGRIGMDKSSLNPFFNSPIKISEKLFDLIQSKLKEKLLSNI